MQVRGQTFLKISTAGVDINGGAATIDGVAFGNTHARIADPMETGQTQLVIDTRTETGTANAADSSSLSFARGGSPKWHVGLNYAGGGVDSFDWYNGATRLQLMATGELIVAGDAPLNYGGVLNLQDTHAGGHNWRIGEFNGVGILAFRDTTTGNFPLQLGSAGGVGCLGPYAARKPTRRHHEPDRAQRGLRASRSRSDEDRRRCNPGRANRDGRDRMTPDEVIALLQVIARQQVQISRLEAALQQAQQPPEPPVTPVP